MLVADAGLGTINAVRLCVDALGAAGADGGVAPRPAVVLNRFDERTELHRRNRAWLEDVDGYDVVPATDVALASLAGRLALGGR